MFEKFTFSERQIKSYYNLAMRDFNIASESDIPEVIFKFTYDSFFKVCDSCLRQGGAKGEIKTGSSY